MVRMAFLIIVLVFSTCLSPCFAASTNSLDLPVVLKINQFYVLYTHPKGPYLDKQNRLMVPLGMFCQRLMGASVEYNTHLKTATVFFSGKTLVLKVGSSTAILDGDPLETCSAPVFDNGHIFVPIRTLIDAFGIAASWNEEYRYLALNDKRLLDTWTIRYLLDSSPGVTENGDAFVPTGVVLSTWRNPATSSKYVKLDIKAKNITGADIPAGKEDLHPYIVYNSGYSHDTGWGHEGQYLRERPFVKAGTTITRSAINNFDPALDKINYILLWCRTIE